MQWFFALAEGCPGFDYYADLARVAVHTAMRHTSLQPHFLYDGDENHFTRWLRDRQVPIIRCRTFLDTELATFKGGPDEANTRSTGRGILLRIELPQLQVQLGLDDRVLYTDCDVFFRRDIAEDLRGLAPHYFAVGPEFSRDDYRHMNTGVMWMNLPQLRTVDAPFRAFVRQNLPRLPQIAWDQGAYREFFAGDENTFQWDRLPPELNWKPYWGDDPQAKVIHFHGPKPFQRPYLDSHFPELKTLTGGSYDDLCEEWAELLAEAK
ncbi:glycosyltransferase [soil metagenome]|nr:hypothetical protein [Chthoniobacterales bacterium]